MKKFVTSITLMFLIIIISGCSKEKVSNEWVADDLAGINNPGFTIVSKTVKNNSTSFELEDIDIELVNQFIDELYLNDEFTININYFYDADSYSYAAFNDKEESVHFTYNITDHTGYFIYAKSGDAVFTPGIRDMGYWIFADYDYMSNAEETHYNASLSYGVLLNTKFTSSHEYLTSFVLKDFKFKSESTLGTIFFCDSPYGDSIDNYTITGANIYDLRFMVCQTNVGQYPVSTPYGETSTFFDTMGINQSELDFIVTFTAEITTSFGKYTHDYEIKFMPSGSAVTDMNRQMTVDPAIKTIDKGIPFIKID